jgi:ribonuclease HII
MRILIGVDEAGYGPNYGPLAVAATAWRVADDARVPGARVQGSGFGVQDQDPIVGPVGVATKAVRAAKKGGELPDLYRLLRKAVVRTPGKAGKKIAIADSKALYSPAVGVGQLERGVLAALALLAADSDSANESPGDRHRCIQRVAELLTATIADPDARRHELPCHGNDEQALPLTSLAQEICWLASLLRRTCEDCGVTLLALRARLIYPAEFNDLCDAFGTKGAALSHVTLALVRQTIDQLPTAHGPLPTHVFLDKHGGRSRYAALLQHHFPDCWIDAIIEGRAESRYQWEHAGAPIVAAFRVGCEELLPTALASMTAKYHREVAMRAFNAFWARHLPALRPTAGYPGDSQRFKADITAKQRELGIDDRMLWRSR